MKSSGAVVKSGFKHQNDNIYQIELLHASLNSVPLIVQKPSSVEKNLF